MTASLPNARPTADTYGPALQNERKVTRPIFEIDCAYWNKIREDLAAAGLVAVLVRAKITNNGSVAVADATPIAPGTITVAHIATGHVRITVPTGVAPRFASFECCVANTVCAFSYTITGQVIDVYTFVSSGGPIALTDVDFSAEVS